jgi:hypothetical protein
MDYEFVQIEKIADDSGRSLPFTSRLQNNPIPSHDPDRDPTQGNSNLYSYKLIDPIQPGDPLLLSITAKINHLIKKDPTGLFQYALNVNPNNNDPVHRIELIRLPAGAVLVSTSDKFATRVIDGRIQLYQDYTIPSGGSQLSTFSYRLPQ